MADTFTSAVEAGAKGGPRFSPEGLEIVRTFEGFRPKAYYDLGGNKGKLTVGYGFTNYDIPELKPGYTIDQKRAEELLPNLINRKYGPSVTRNVKVPLTDQQYSALTSLVYNIGPTNFAKSTLLQKLNSGDYEGAAGEFGKWIYAGGKPATGLVRRRAAEQALFKGENERLVNILEGQKFGLPMPGGLSQTKQGGQEDFVAAMEDAVYRDTGARATKEEAEQLLPAQMGGAKVEKQTAEQLVASSDKWQGFEERLKKLTENLPEPPPAEGPKPDTQIAQADPFSELPPPAPAKEKLGPEDSTVNKLLKIAGKEPIDLSKIGSNTSIDFKFGVGDVLAGVAKDVGRGLVDYFAQGGSATPVPDNVNNATPQIPMAENVELGSQFTTAQAGLPRAAGLAPRRMG